MEYAPTAYPFIDVNIDTSGLVPRLQPAGGVLAVIGETEHGAATPDVPYPIPDLDEAVRLFASRDEKKVPVPTPLYSALAAALGQQHRPQQVYGVRTTAGDPAAGLAATEGLEVAVVCLAGTWDIGQRAAPGKPATGLCTLHDHVTRLAGNGQRRLAVAALTGPLVDSAGASAAEALLTAVEPLRSDDGRMVLVAAPGATGEVAAAVAAVLAASPPQASLALKAIQAVTIEPADRLRPSQIATLGGGGVNPLIDTALIPGSGLYLAEGKAFCVGPAFTYVDTRRVVDHIEFLLRAGLIGTIGDARITQEGLTLVRQRCSQILAPLVRDAVIVSYTVQIPVLDILGTPPAAWTEADGDAVRTARQTRTVELRVSVEYGPAVHRLSVSLAVTN